MILVFHVLLDPIEKFVDPSVNAWKFGVGAFDAERRYSND
jgi:hypothetical protein